MKTWKCCTKTQCRRGHTIFRLPGAWIPLWRTGRTLTAYRCWTANGNFAITKASMSWRMHFMRRITTYPPTIPSMSLVHGRWRDMICTSTPISVIRSRLTRRMSRRTTHAGRMCTHLITTVRRKRPGYSWILRGWIPAFMSGWMEPISATARYHTRQANLMSPMRSWRAATGWQCSC